MKVRLSRALVVACAVLVLTGLWGSGTSGALVGRASAPDGYDTKKIKSAGLSLALPSTWLSLDPKSKRTKAIIDAAVAKNPNLKDVPAEFDAIKSQVAYWAVDADAADFAANVFVLPLALDKSIVKSPADVEAMFQAQAGSLASDVAAQPV